MNILIIVRLIALLQQEVILLQNEQSVATTSPVFDQILPVATSSASETIYSSPWLFGVATSSYCPSSDTTGQWNRFVNNDTSVWWHESANDEAKALGVATMTQEQDIACGLLPVYDTYF
jgi:hypothetical protein